MLRVLLILSVLLLQVPIQAQTPPNWSKIEIEVSDPSSPYYYPALMNRYAVGDTTLTFNDYYYLYYGYPSQPSYKPLLPNPYADSLDNLFGRRTTPNTDTFRKAAKLATATLSTEPFNLRDINVLAFALDMTEQKEEASREMRKLSMLTQVIKSTGTGLTEKSPWYVTYSNHANDIVALMGMNIAKTIIVSTTVEFLQVTNAPDKRIKGYYFNYAEIYRRRPEYLDNIPKPKRKMELNPRYNPNSKLNTLPR